MAEVENGYTEEIAIEGVTVLQYIAATKVAAAYLHWPLVAVTDNTVTCLTTGDGYFNTGDRITISIGNTKSIFHSASIDGYDYYDRHRHNAAIFRQALTAALAEQEKAERNKHPMHREPYGALVISETYLVTPVIVYLNALVFIFMVLAGISPINPAAQKLYDWGGNFRPSVIGGDWWRLITYIFLHGGFMHLLMNTFGLLYIGMYLEPLLGRFRFGAAYLLTGICAGLLSITIHTGSVGVGASGAIFGMYGVFLSMLTTSHLQRTVRRTMLRSLLFFVVLNLLYGLQGNTDNAAHIGGLLSGIAIGYIYYPGIAKKDTMKKQLLTTMAIAAGVFILVLGLLYL